MVCCLLNCEQVSYLLLDLDWRVAPSITSVDAETHEVGRCPAQQKYPYHVGFAPISLRNSIGRPGRTCMWANPRKQKINTIGWRA